MKTSACPIRILLIDDDQRFADTARHKLGTAGLRTALDSAPSLKNAISRLDRKNFDIVILNPYFGQIQGEAAYLAVRKRAWNMPVLLMVPARHEAPALRLLDLGADDCLIKERTRPTMLFHTARSLVQRCTLRQRLHILETVATQASDQVSNTIGNKRVDGAVFWTELKVVTKKNVEKALRHLVLIQKDACEEKSVQSCLNRISLLQKQQSFMTQLAHDFKAPLAGAILATQVIKDRRLGPLTAEQTTVIDQLQSSNKQLLRLATNMLEMYDEQERNIRPSPFAFKLKNFIQDCAFSAMPLAKANEIRIVTDVALKFEEYYADQDALKLLISNLLDNALIISPRGGCVSLIARSIGKEIVIRVIDQGPALTTEQQAQVFRNNWHYQDNPRYTAASSLALHICNRIVNAYGGSIRCFSSPIEETVWEVALPLVHDSNHR